MHDLQRLRRIQRLPSAPPNNVNLCKPAIALWPYGDQRFSVSLLLFGSKFEQKQSKATKISVLEFKLQLVSHDAEA
jgi:hypothetical protein